MVFGIVRFYPRRISKGGGIGRRNREAEIGDPSQEHSQAIGSVERGGIP